MRDLNNILQGVEIKATEGKAPAGIKRIHFDSRLVGEGDLYVAQKGTRVDGHDFIDECIEKGASVIVCSTMPAKLHANTFYIMVEDSSKALGIMASNFYDNPSAKLKLVGITGTNGKTSTVTMLYNLYRSLGYPAGLLSTVKNKINDTDIAATHTTPDAIQINKLLDEMCEAGCEYCFMEVSSHALVQNRVAGLKFRGAVFSNITHDHLDFHKTFKEYIKAKKLFFDNLESDAFALVNVDDKNGLVMVQNTVARVRTYSLGAASDYRAKIIENSFEGLHLYIDDSELWLPLVGKFNAHNILSVYAVAMELGSDKEEVLKELSRIETAEGRFEVIRSKQGITAIVDYAHTPDALSNVLQTINEIRGGNGRLITVVGAGGNRDKTKRPEMAAIAAEMSDRVILTSDNPRDEDPEEIIKEMETGVEAPFKNRVLSIKDRKQAIKTAVALAAPQDIILIAGKGHEKYQEIKGVRHHFDDKEIINELLNNE